MIVITSTGLRINTAHRYDRAADVRAQAAEAAGRLSRAPAHARLARGEGVVIFSRRSASGGLRATTLSPR